MKNLPNLKNPKIFEPAVFETVRKYRSASKAEETKRAFLKNWRKFESWCASQGTSSFPCSSNNLENYLAHMASGGYKVSSIEQANWAINIRHRLEGVPAPGDTQEAQATLAGIKRTHLSAQQPKEALTWAQISQLRFSDNLIDQRNKAILLIGFSGGFRRSELAAIQAEDIAQAKEGIRIFIRSSKTDKEGQGAWVSVVRAKQNRSCPVLALETWLKVSDIQQGSIFRSINRWGQIKNQISAVSIGNIVKNAAASLGLNPKNYGGHSLRSGCATFLIENNVNIAVVAKHGRWKKLDTVLRYDRGHVENSLKDIF